MIQSLISTLMALLASILSGIMLRINPSRAPSTEDFEKFVKVLFSHEIAHRGGSHDAPENTICAFQKAVQHGYKAIELDIQFTSDGEAVVIHDESLDRTTNGKGEVSDSTLEEVKSLSANNNFSDVGDCKVPTLDEAIEFAIANNLILLFDVKGGVHCSKFTKTLTRILKKYPQFSNYFAVISFFPDILYQVRQTHPTVITGFTRSHDDIQDKVTKAGFKSPALQPLLLLADRVFDFVMFYYFVPWMKINMLEIRKNDVSEQYVQSVAPLPVLTWTVNDPAEKKFFKRIGCSVMTDVVSDALPVVLS